MTTLVKRKTVATPWDKILGGLITPGVNPNAAVNAQVNAALAANKAAVAGQTLQLQNQAKRAQGFAEALGSYIRPDADAVGAQYRDAAKTFQSFGTGLTGAVAETQQQQADRIAQQVADVTGGLGHVSSFDVPGLRSAAQYGSVVLPARSLTEEAARAYSDARAAGAASAGGIGAIAQEYLRKVDEMNADVAAKNAAVQATRPSLFLEAQKAADENRRANIATYIQAKYLGNTMRETSANISLNKQKMKQDVKAAKDAALPTFDATRSRAKGYEVDQFGNPLRDASGNLVALPGYKINKAGTAAVKVPTGSTVSGKPLSLKEKQTASQLAYGIANTGLSGIKYDKDGNKKTVPKLSYQGAFEQMRNAGLFADPRTRAIAIKALNETYKVNGAATDLIDWMAKNKIPLSPGKPLSAKQKKLMAKIFPLLPGFENLPPDTNSVGVNP